MNWAHEYIKAPNTLPALSREPDRQVAPRHVQGGNLPAQSGFRLIPRLSGGGGDVLYSRSVSLLARVMRTCDTSVVYGPLKGVDPYKSDCCTLYCSCISPCEAYCVHLVHSVNATFAVMQVGAFKSRDLSYSCTNDPRTPHRICASSFVLCRGCSPYCKDPLLMSM